jgi:hypothetical protein
MSTTPGEGVKVESLHLVARTKKRAYAARTRFSVNNVLGLRVLETSLTTGADHAATLQRIFSLYLALMTFFPADVSPSW